MAGTSPSARTARNTSDVMQVLDRAWVAFRLVLISSHGNEGVPSRLRLDERPAEGFH